MKRNFLYIFTMFSMICAANSQSLMDDNQKNDYEVIDGDNDQNNHTKGVTVDVNKKQDIGKTRVAKKGKKSDNETYIVDESSDDSFFAMSPEDDFLTEDMEYNKKRIDIEVNNYKFIKLKRQPGSIFISNPDIGDVRLHSATTFSLMGLKIGETNFVIKDRKGCSILSSRIVITHNFTAIKDMIKRVHPDVDISLEQISDGVLIHGIVPSPEISASIQQIVAKFIGGEANVINKLQIQTATQVLLKVKIAEVKREISKEFGINWRTISEVLKTTGYNVGLLSGQGLVPKIYLPSPSGKVGGAELVPPTGGEGEPAETTERDTFKSINYPTGDDLVGPNRAQLMLNWVHQDKGYDIGAVIDALASEGLALILAEPTLVAMSGKAAVFKSGGEYGYELAPVTTGAATTTEFKEWGTSITFTPTVISEDRILINVNPKVSSLDNSKSKVPALNVREAQTTVELGSGQSLAIAGLLQRTVNSSRFDVPILSSLPFFGPLFRSSALHKVETELVIIVTAYIVKPSSKQLNTPIDMIPKLLAPAEQIFKNSFARKISYTDAQSVAVNTGYIVS